MSIQFLIAVLILLIFAPIDAISHQKFKRKTNIFFHVFGLFFVIFSAIILIIKEFKFSIFLFPGILISFIGFLILYKATKDLKENFWEAREIINSGFYSKTRHPIYFGLIISLLGLSLAVFSLLFFIYILIAILILIILAYYEEKHLIKKFLYYEKYKKRTSFLIPKFKIISFISFKKKKE